MIKVYHGGIDAILKPLVKAGRKDLDFGQGFYLTRRLSQAQEWADRVARRYGVAAVVNEYELDIEKIADECRYRVFEDYDAEWLHFIISCRQGYDSSTDYDCVEGGVANDRVIDTVEGFMNGTISEEYALTELSKHRPNNQICLLSQYVIDNYLKFVKTL